MEQDRRACCDLETQFKEVPKRNIGAIISQLKLVARLISIRNQRGKGINRDVFYCEHGGYDHHNALEENMGNKLPSLNDAITNFWAEIKAQGIENVSSLCKEVSLEGLSHPTAMPGLTMAGVGTILVSHRFNPIAVINFGCRIQVINNSISFQSLGVISRAVRSW